MRYFIPDLRHLPLQQFRHFNHNILLLHIRVATEQLERVLVGSQIVPIPWNPHVLVASLRRGRFFNVGSCIDSLVRHLYSLPVHVCFPRRPGDR